MCSCAFMDLYQAINANDIEAVRGIIVKYSKKFHGKLNNCPSELPEISFSPLANAMILGHEKIVELFIDFGATIDNYPFSSCKNSIYRDLTFFHYLAYLGNDWHSRKKVAEILIRHRIDVNGSCDGTGSPLSAAISRGNVTCAEFFLKNGAVIKGTAEQTQLKLFLKVLCAPKSNQTELLHLLVKYGFDTSLLHADSGFDCVQITILKATRDDQSNKTDVVGIVKILIRCGVSANGVDKLGTPTLIYALELQNVELVSFLIKSGADVNIKPKLQEQSFLHVAARMNSRTFLNLLLLNGVNINIKCEQGWTALHQACSERSGDAIDFLIQNGASISEEEKNGRTPFSLLEPEQFNESDVPCINIMVKEFAKLKFSGSIISKKDMELLDSHVDVQEYFQNCTKELNVMSSTKLYDFYSYYYVLKMSKRSKRKLANLTKNNEFVTKFEENINKFFYYKSDLQRIMEDAIQIRDESIIVDSRLKTAFGDSLPDVVKKILALHLRAKDLPLQPVDSGWKCDRRFSI